MRIFPVVAAALFVLAACSAEPSSAARAPASSPAPAPAEGRCEHGVDTALCARCNPKLAAAFKAKGDWCDEHEVPESQCAACDPELAKAGVK